MVSPTYLFPAGPRREGYKKVRARVANPTPAQSSARGTSFLPCPFSGPNSVHSGSTSLSFQGPGRCHLICCLLAHCWQWPGPLPHPEQDEQHLLLFDCCLLLPPDLYMCVCGCEGWGPLAWWLLLRCMENCFAGCRGPPVLVGCGSHLPPQCCPLPCPLCLWEVGPGWLEGPRSARCFFHQ